MYTYTGLRNFFGTLTNNTSPANLALADQLINDADAEVINLENWDFLETTNTATTVAQQQYYGMPYNIDTLKSLVVTNGGVNYVPRACPSRDVWNKLNESTTIYADIPEWYYVTLSTVGGTIGLYPVPATNAGSTMTMIFQQKRKDLTQADYTTGTIVTANNGLTSIIGSGTSWTSKMNGFWIKLADGLSSNTGDGYWYQIASVQSSTQLTLVAPYGGLSISGGSVGYIIGQCSLIPEDFQTVPVYRAAQVFYTSIQPDINRAGEMKAFFNDGLSRMRKGLNNKISSPVIEDEDEDDNNYDPNLHIHL
jgi:hypothetical protein